MNAFDNQAMQALSTAGAQCGNCGDEPGDRNCPDCERCYERYVAALRAAGWAPRTEALIDASTELEKDYRLWQTEPRWREGKGDSRGPGMGHAMTRLERMADQADPRCPVCKGDGGDPEDPGDWCPEVGMHNPTTRGPCLVCHGSGLKKPA